VQTYNFFSRKNTSSFVSTWQKETHDLSQLPKNQKRESRYIIIYTKKNSKFVQDFPQKNLELPTIFPLKNSDLSIFSKNKSGFITKNIFKLVSTGNPSTPSLHDKQES
ncbi:unnamed protein product, partial [Prunus brigantina]